MVASLVGQVVGHSLVVDKMAGTDIVDIVVDMVVDMVVVVEPQNTLDYG